MTTELLTARNDGVLEVTFNRPEKYNAITQGMLDGLIGIVRAFSADPDDRVLLIRSTGKYFSAGADFAAIDFSGAGDSTSRFRHIYRAGGYSYHPLGDEIEAAEKPVVIVHQGPCLGGALEFSLSCDFRLAGRSARYGLPELNFGMIPGSGGVSRLVRLVGPHWARWLVVAGETIDAEQARSIGMVHQVYDDEALDAEARAFCAKLAARPVEAMAMAKLSIELAQDLDRSQARNIERLANSALYIGSEHKALMAAVAARFAKS